MALRENLLKKPDSKWQLFDLESDIGESKDVAASHDNVIDRINRIARQSHVPSELFPFPALDNSK